jgi:putative sugar O-methyltransferase
MRPPTDAIVSQARAHLLETLSHQSKLPEYGSRWQPQVEAIGRDISSLTDSDACLRYAQYNITFDGRPPFPGDTGIVQMREWAVANEFPQHAGALLLMSENPMSGAESLGEFNGRLVSLVMYYHARNVLAALTYADKPRRIVEIGGGYGEIARMWLKNPIAPPQFYVIADIPECLFFAEVALRAEFGDKVGYFDGSDPGSPILLVPLPFLADFRRSSDIVINTGSMQEMTDEWIDFYMAWLSHYDTRYFYCLNYAAQPISIMGESRNLWTQRPGPEWSTRHLRLNIPLQDLVGPTRDYLETLYEKTPATRSLKEWSIYRGHILSKTTYVEGLDLLRQNLTIENASTFLNTVMEYMPYHPKELLWIARWLVNNGASPYSAACKLLEAELGGELYHDPPAPARAPNGAP